MKTETKCIHGGYVPKDGEPLALPIYQSTTYVYDSTEHIGKLFDLAAEGHMYSRISNPTVSCVEKKIAELDGGVGAICTVSGQSAVFLSLFNVLGSGDHFITSSEIYGGTVNLFAITMKKLGIDCTFISQDSTEEEIQAAFRPNTKALFGETLANPAISVLDIEKFARVAHKNGVPLIIDNTFPTPILCKPIEYGADIVVYSTTKYMDGHGIQVGGAIVDSGKFDWTNGKFPEFTTPDKSYHGLVFTEAFGDSAYIIKARTQLVRDLGVCAPATLAFYLDLGLQTLHLRMERHSENALKVAEYLEASSKIESVNYPGLKSNKYYDLARKYLTDGRCAGVVSFTVKGGKQAAIKVMDNLALSKKVVHVATVQTCVLHPATATHRQLDDEQLVAAGINPGLIRLSVGIENIDDIIADLDHALSFI